jgi:hypothetical protein
VKHSTKPSVKMSKKPTKTKLLGLGKKKRSTNSPSSGLMGINSRIPGLGSNIVSGLSSAGR